jgi:isoleucyl-tRNA synthetase
LDRYNPTLAARQIENFVGNLSNWYVRRSRRRFWKSENDADKLAAYTTLYQCLVTLSRLLAPLAPFTAEELYQNLVRSVEPETKESVHLTDFPIADMAKIDDKLAANVELTMKISSLGRAARAKAGIKVRQPLAKAAVKAGSKAEKEALRRSATEIMEEINVKEIEFSTEGPFSDMPGYSVADDSKYWVAISTELTPELVAEGVSREIVRRLQDMRRSANFDVADHIVTYYQAEEPVRRAMIDFASYIKQETLSQELINELPPKEAYIEKHRISGRDVLLAVKKQLKF